MAIELDVNDPVSIKQFIKDCSKKPGIYQMLSDTGGILYVGKANNLANRLASYFNKNTGPKTIALIKQTCAIKTTITNTEAEALILECNLIKQHKPKYNILLRDDKSYPYICLSNHIFPRIYLFRGRRPKNSLCFGPYPNVNAAKETIKLLQQVFLIRSCTDGFFKNRTRPCLLFQINRCSAPCVSNINKEVYAESIKNSQDFLEGKSQDLISKFAKLMEEASKEQHYEQAALLRDQIRKLQAVFTQQYVADNNAKTNKATDVIACIVTNNILVMSILQFRNGSLLGSREYIDKISLEHNTQESYEEIILTALGQFYVNLPESAIIPSEIVINVDFIEDSKTLLSDLLLKLSSDSHADNSHAGSIDINTHPRRSKLKWLSLAEKNASELLEKNRKKAAVYENQFLLLKKALGLANIPAKIECFDVSHTFGNQTIASCVVFKTTGPDKSNYRRYNIDSKKGDDVAAMYDVLLRRYKKILATGNLELMPDLILIDGGKTQVNAAKKVFDDLDFDLCASSIKIYGITKGDRRRAELDRILEGEILEYIHISEKSEAKHLLQQIRDEAHRFAIVGHRAKRTKEQTTSILEELPGIGAMRRKNLLIHFGGWQQIALATIDQLATVPGISKAKAQMIYDYLHDRNIKYNANERKNE